jgi:hypothetical protein
MKRLMELAPANVNSVHIRGIVADVTAVLIFFLLRLTVRVRRLHRPCAVLSAGKRPDSAGDGDIQAAALIALLEHEVA